MANQKIQIPIRQRLQDFQRGPLVLLIWLACASGVAWLIQAQPRAARYVGWVPPVEFAVSGPVTGTLGTVLVEPMERVRKGQLVAQLDPRPLQARLATANAEVAELAARVADAATDADYRDTLTRAQLGRDAEAEQRRFAGDRQRYILDETRLRVDVHSLQIGIATDRVEIDRIDARLKRAAQLGKRGMVAEAEVEDLQLQKAEVGTRVIETETRLEGIRRDLARAERLHLELARLEPEFCDAIPTPRAMAALEAAVRVQSLRVSELELERENLALRSPIDGHVTALLAGEGQAVLAGAAVLVVSESAPREAVVFVAAHEASPDLVGRRVELWGRSDATVVESRVAAAAPLVQQLPERLWSSPAVPAWGIALRVPIASADEFLFGQQLAARVLPSEQ